MTDRKNRKRLKKQNSYEIKVSEIKSKLSWFWRLILWNAIFAAVACTIGCCTASWFITDKYKFAYSPAVASRNIAHIRSGYFGLLLTYMNESAYTITWGSRAAMVCDTANRIRSEPTATISKACSMLCLTALDTRCSAYQIIYGISSITISLLLIVSLLTILSAFSVLIFGKKVRFIKIVWIGGSLMAFGLISLVVFTFRYQMNNIRNSSYFPDYSLGYSLYLAVAAFADILFSGILIGFAGFLDNRRIQRLKRQKIMEKAVEEKAKEVVHNEVTDQHNFKLMKPTFLPPRLMLLLFF